MKGTGVEMVQPEPLMTSDWVGGVTADAGRRTLRNGSLAEIPKKAEVC